MQGESENEIVFALGIRCEMSPFVSLEEMLGICCQPGSASRNPDLHRPASSQTERCGVGSLYGVGIGTGKCGVRMSLGERSGRSRLFVSAGARV